MNQHFVADLACSRTRSMRVASHPAARAAHPGCRVRGARGTRSPRPCRRLLRARAAEAGRADPADRGARERADDVPAALRAWCAATRGGVDATVADIDALRRLVASAETASGSASDAAFAEPASSCLPEASSSPSPSSSSERWRLLGAAQRTEPSPGLGWRPPSSGSPRRRSTRATKSRSKTMGRTDRKAKRGKRTRRRDSPRVSAPAGTTRSRASGGSRRSARARRRRRFRFPSSKAL